MNVAPPTQRLHYVTYGREVSELPHVAKVSGGRSSALMALRIAEQGGLRPERGDLALFANTSAEHPATYEFACRVSDKLEEHGLPVLWYEFCTVEDAQPRSNRGYRRRDSYRLVNRLPHSGGNPDGYRSDGSVFEEYLSWKQRLPNPQLRSCTSHLKLLPSHQLLDEWFNNGLGGPTHAGHWGETPHLTAALLWASYRGQMPRTEFMDKTAAMLAAPHHRLAQRWQSFSSVPVGDRPDVKHGGLFAVGVAPTRYVTLVGLRADERRRVDRILSRTVFAEGAGSAKCRIKTQPPGEMPAFPLYDSGLTKEDVLAWWNDTPPVEDLGCSDQLGNCTFCFMKGPRSLAAISRQHPVPEGAEGTPVDINWWVNTEKKYRRQIPARDPVAAGKKSATFGFLGIGRESYAQIRAGNTPETAPRRDAKPVSVGVAACDCTD